MTTKERLQIVYETLRNHGIVHTKKDLANLIGTSAPNVSNAFKGDERFLTNNFLSRLNKAVNYMFNQDWLLHDEGEMLVQPQGNTVMASNNSYGDNASGNNNTTITPTQETNFEDNANSVILRPIVNKLLASRPNTDVYKIVKGDGVKLQHILAFPQYDDFDFYYQVRQDAMFPTYDKGDILALMHMPVDAHIIQGSAMVIDTKSFGFLFRRVYDNGDSYECKCINENSVFRNQSIPKDDVIRLYRVIYSIKSGD